MDRVICDIIEQILTHMMIINTNNVFINFSKNHLISHFVIMSLRTFNLLITTVVIIRLTITEFH